MPVILPEPLLQAARERKLVLFAGSGLSMMAGYPGWSQLIDRLVAEAKRMPNARLKGLPAIEARRDYLMLAEFARMTMGSWDYTEILKEELGRPVRTTEAHRLIAATDYRGIITTNYDRLFEIVIPQVRSWAPNTFSHEAISLMGSALFNPELFLFKMHGDLASPSSIVLSSRDYERLILLSPHVRALLMGVFLNYKLLFVGYGLRDPDFNLILRELTLIFENYVPKHYALVPDPGSFESDHLLRQMNIQVIGYDPADDHREVVEVLRQLREVAPAPLAVAA
jgi:SIR2-like domain